MLKFFVNLLIILLLYSLSFSMEKKEDKIFINDYELFVGKINESNLEKEIKKITWIKFSTWNKIKNNGKDIWYKFNIHNRSNELDLLVLKNIRFISSVYIDYKVVNKKQATERTLLIELNKQGSTHILVKVESEYNLSGILSIPYITSKKNIDFINIRNEASNIIVGLSILIVGLFSSLLVFVRYNKLSFSFFSVTAILIGFYTIIKTCFIEYFIYDAYFLAVMEYITLYSIPIAFSLFFWITVNKNKIFFAMSIFYFVFAFVSIFCHIFNITSIFSFLIIFHSILFIGFVIIAIYFFIYKEYIVFIGLVVLITTASFDISRSYSIKTFETSIVHWGFLVFIVSLAIIIIIKTNKIFIKEEEISNELNLKNIILLENEALKNNFFANASYELKTPLNGIIGMAESLYDSSFHILNEKQRSDLMLVICSTKRLNILADNIAQFYITNENNMKLQKCDFLLYDIVSFTIKTLEYLLVDKKLKITSFIAIDFNPIYGDPNKIQQVLFYLLENAIKFTKEGEINITAVIADNKAIIAVQDTGIGIEKNKFTEIFKPFEQANSEIKKIYGGSGMGLSICKLLIEAHNEKIWLESEINKGSTFFFSLELSKNNNQIKNISDFNNNFLNWEDSSFINIKPENLSNDPIILIINHDQVNRQILFNQLSSRNYIIKFTNDIKDTLEFLSTEKKLDLILLDSTLFNHNDALLLCSKIREKYSSTELPIIFLSIRNQISDITEAFNFGVNDYIAKPFILNELLSRIKIHLTLSKNIIELKTISHRQQTLLSLMYDLSIINDNLVIIKTVSEHIMNWFSISEDIIKIAISENENSFAEQYSYYSFKLTRYKTQFEWNLLNTEPFVVWPSDGVVDEVNPEYAWLDAGLEIISNTNSKIIGVIRISNINQNMCNNSDLEFIKLVAKSLSIIQIARRHENQKNYERTKRIEEQQEALRNLIKIVAEISDTLNSPLLVLDNIISDLIIKFNQISTKLENNIESINIKEINELLLKLSLKKVIHLEESINQIKKVSVRLSQLRDKDKVLETTKLIT